MVDTYRSEFAFLVPLYCGYTQDKNIMMDGDGFRVIIYNKTDSTRNGVMQLNMINEFPTVTSYIISDWCDQMNITTNRFNDLYKVIESQSKEK